MKWLWGGFLENDGVHSWLPTLTRVEPAQENGSEKIARANASRCEACGQLEAGAFHGLGTMVDAALKQLEILAVPAGPQTSPR